MPGSLYFSIIKHQPVLMEFVVKDFNALSVKELFEIYKLRSEVFIVEQNCAYQDVDDKDLSSLHLMLYKEEELIGYCRILPPGISYKESSIGRVAVKESQRKLGAGKFLMKYSISKTLELFKDQDIVISAQSYLLKFYSDLGFSPEGKGYLEDNIPHIKMRHKSH